jgi:pimeloyl-ACP methyl ester carboxylesterase
MYVVTFFPTFSKLIIFLQGTKDVTVHPKYFPLIAALLPAGTQKKLITVDGAGHDVTLSHSDDVNGELSDFFGFVYEI